VKRRVAGNPEKAFSSNGNKYKDQARIAELERLFGQYLLVNTSGGPVLRIYRY
jgi:hypothetical protein